MFLTLVGIAAIAAAVYFLIQRISEKIYYNLPPSTWNVPIFGSIFFLSKKPWVTMKKWAEQYGPIFRTKFGLTDIVVINDPQMLKEAFNDPILSGRNDNKLFTIFTDGKHGIVSADGQEWTEQRRFVVKTLRDFGFGKQSMESLVLEEVQDYLKWMKINEGKPTIMNQRFVIATVNSLWALIAGTRHDPDDPFINEIIDKSVELFNSLQKNVVFLLFPQLIDILPEMFLKNWAVAKQKMIPFRKLFEDAMEEHIRNPIRDDEISRDLIDAYIQEIKKTDDPNSTFHESIGYKSLIYSIGDLYGAATGTTSSILSWTVLYLARFPEIQRKLQKELDAVIGPNRLPSLSDKPRLAYTEALTNEVFRHAAITPFGLFHEAMKDTKLRGFDIKKGSTVIGNLYSISYSEKIWGDPEVFRPERFLTTDGKELIKSDNLNPFGVGKRICPGESFGRSSVFLFLTSIFLKFNVVADPLSNPIPSLEAEGSFFRDPKKFYVIISERK